MFTLLYRWRWFILLFIVGGLAGAAAIVGSVEINRVTSTDKFCTSCHSMAMVAADPHYLNAAHIGNSVGVRVTCADCHIPKTNWFVETYTHVRSGLRDVIAESTHNYADPKTWEARRVALATEVHDVMRGEDNATCTSCHTLAYIKPTSAAGQASHATLQDNKMACVDCHANLVHAPTASHSAN
jgi:nitrate/TMAO reductase-like tetraheme cytochrome c subunit